MPFKDGRLTPAEKRAMGKRYGEKEGTYRRAGANYLNEDTPDTFNDRLVKASQNDYDTRKAQEFMNAALKDDELRASLGKKAQKFLDNYKSNDKKDSGLVGISNMKELLAVNDFSRLYHKNERNNGGQFSSANDYGGNTEHMGNALRKHYDRNFVTKDELNSADDEKEKAPKLPDRLPSYNDYIRNTEGDPADGISRDSFEDEPASAEKGAQQLFADKMNSIVADSSKIQENKNKMGKYVLSNLGSDVFETDLNSFIV